MTDTGYEFVGLADYTSLSSHTQQHTLPAYTHKVSSVANHAVYYTYKQLTHVWHTLSELVATNGSNTDDTLYGTVVYTPNELTMSTNDLHDSTVQYKPAVTHDNTDNTAQTLNLVPQPDAYQLLDNWRTSTTLTMLSPTHSLYTVSHKILQPLQYVLNINTTHHTTQKDYNADSNTLRDDIVLALRCWSLERHGYTLPQQWIVHSTDGITLNNSVTTNYAITCNSDSSDNDIETTLKINFDPLAKLQSWLDSSMILSLTSQLRHDIDTALVQWKTERLYRWQHR